MLLAKALTIKIGEIVITVVTTVTGSVGEFPTSRYSFLSAVLMSLSSVTEIQKWSKTKVQGTGKHPKKILDWDKCLNSGMNENFTCKEPGFHPASFLIHLQVCCKEAHANFHLNIYSLTEHLRSVLRVKGWAHCHGWIHWFLFPIITEYPELEWTHGDHQVQLLALQRLEMEAVEGEGCTVISRL